jgi:hypothetical protein
MKIHEYNEMMAWLKKPKRLFSSRKDTIGGGAIQGENLGSRTGFGSPEAIEYLKSLKPGSAVNTYAIGKQFGIAPATVRGQVERNFPELRLQTREESAAIAKETRREQYRQKKSDVPVPETGVRGKGAESRTKGRDVTNVRWPSEEMKNEYLGNLKDRYSDVKGRKGLTNKELAIKFFGEDTKANVGQIEKINRYYIEDLKLDFKPAPKSEVGEKRKRRLAITQDGRTFKGTDKIPFHHIMPIGGEVDLTTKDVAFISKEMNSRLAEFNTRLNDIADAISNNLNNQEPGYLDRIDELNNQAEKIIEGVKTKLPKKYQGYIGFNRLDPILDENGTPIRLNVTRVGVDDSKSIAGKKGETIKLKDLTQKGLEEYGKNRKQVKEYLYDRFCVKGKAQGGRIGFANGPCTPDTVVDGMKKAIQQGDSAKVLKALNVGKNLLGYAIAPADIAIETAFALPYLLEGDLEGAKAATTAGLFGWGKDLQEQVGDRFGTNSPAYGSLEKQRAIDLQVEGMFEMDKALAYGEKSGVFTKDKDGNYTKNPNLSVSQIDSFKNANNIFKSGAEKTMEAKNLFIDALPKIEGLENESTATSQLGVFSDELRSGVLDQKIGDPGIIANLTKSLNVSQPADTSKVKPFIETMGGETKFPIPSRVAEGSDLIKERIDQLREMRIGDYPPDVALGIPSYEKEQAYEGIRPYALKYGPKAAKEFFEAQGIDTEPYLKGMAPILYMKQGGRIQFANGGRLSFAEGPEDPKKRATLKKIGIGGGIAGGLATGLINILDLFKGGAKTGVVATKAAQSQAEKLFFDLVNAVKNKGIIDKLDRASDFSRGGAYYEYKGVKVLEDGENIELQFTTDKGAPAVVEYRKPSYDVDPEAGTSYKVPGEFTNEGQEIARYGQDGDVNIDFENEIIDPIENVKKIIDD